VTTDRFCLSFFFEGFELPLGHSPGPLLQSNAKLLALLHRYNDAYTTQKQQLKSTDNSDGQILNEIPNLQQQGHSGFEFVLVVHSQLFVGFKAAILSRCVTIQYKTYLKH